MTELQYIDQNYFPQGSGRLFTVDHTM